MKKQPSDSEFPQMPACAAYTYLNSHDYSTIKTTKYGHFQQLIPSIHHKPTEEQKDDYQVELTRAKLACQRGMFATKDPHHRSKYHYTKPPAQENDHDSQKATGCNVLDLMLKSRENTWLTTTNSGSSIPNMNDLEMKKASVYTDGMTDYWAPHISASSKDYTAELLKANSACLQKKVLAPYNVCGTKGGFIKSTQFVREGQGTYEKVVDLESSSRNSI